MPSAKENRIATVARKRQLSVSKLIILCIIRALTSENRNPNLNLLHMLGLVSALVSLALVSALVSPALVSAPVSPALVSALVSPTLGQKRSGTQNERAHQLKKACDRLFKLKQHLQARW